MMIEVNYMAVLVAAVASFIVGFVWYHPKVFGAMWMKLVNVTPDMTERAKKNMLQSMTIAALSAIVTAYVLAHFVAAWGAANIMDAVQLGFWAWFGFQTPIILGRVLWEMKSWNLFFLNGAYWLVSSIVIAVVLVWFQ